MNAESTLSTLSPSPILHPIPVTSIIPSRWQPRSTWDPEALLELAKDIRDHGLIYPVILFAKGDNDYELVAGERRTRAIVALALADIPAWSTHHGPSLHAAIDYVAAQGWLLLDQDPAIWTALAFATILARLEDPADLPRLHQLVVADNIQRQNLSPIEEAKAIQDLMDANGLTQRAVADQLGWSQQKVADRLSLLKLAPEVRNDLTAQAVSPTHARSIARLPVDVQPAFSKVAQEMIRRQGDQATTTGQVAALASTVRRFLEPDHWLPAPDAVLPPDIRNRMRLVRHLLTRLRASGKLSERSPAIMALRDDGAYDHANLLGRKPDLICRNTRSLETILYAIIGAQLGAERADLHSVWSAAAIENLWTCSTCRLGAVLPPPGDLDFTLPCDRWHSEETRPDTSADVSAQPITCLFWSSNAEPLVVPAVSQLTSWSEQLHFDGFRHDPFPHYDDLDLWLAAARAATAARHAQDQERTHSRDTRHLRELAAYVAEQRSRFADVSHFQAHLCSFCIYQQQRPDDLPPCLFAVQPLDDYGRPKAPDFGLLVRQDGLMVPRCSHFRLAQVDVAPMPGFRLPDRPAVLAWIRRLATWPQRNNHDHTLFTGLAWLPYDRPDPKTVHDPDRLVRYLDARWDDLGDDRMATLLHTLCSEIGAMANYRNEFDLFDPTTLRIERWASAPWSILHDHDQSYRLSDYPKSWPRPWEVSA